jgi:imidazolonepropionase
MTLAVVNCSQLVTLAGPARPRVREELKELGVIRDGAMLIEAGRIAQVGTRAQIESSIGADTRVIDAKGRLVMPGFVDAHTHPVFAGNRAQEFEQKVAGVSYQEIAAAGGGIRSTVRATRAASEDELLAVARRRSEWFLCGGTTTIEAKSGYGLSTETECKLLRVIARLNEIEGPRYVPTFLGAHEIPDEYRERRDAYVELLVEEMLPAAAPLARYCDIFCEEHVFSIEESRQILSAAQRFGLGLRMHVDQIRNTGGAMLAAELGAKTADHLEQTGAGGIAALARAGVQPVLLPGSVYALGLKKYADARAMIDAGLAVVIATDFNPGSSPTASMPMILSLACTQMRMMPAEAITAATINAAYSLDLGAEIGSLEVGKRADFVIHDREDYRELAYWFGGEPAAAVFANGQCVFAREPMVS